VAVYYFFRISDSGRVEAREQHDCRHDAHAFYKARAISNGQDIEIWRGAMRIALRKRDRLAAIARRMQLRTPAAAN
jgi:hypothetical protein